MGAIWSKNSTESGTTPTKTTKIHPIPYELASDPRSPTIDINRTPMQNGKALRSPAVTKHKNLSNPSTPLKNTAVNIFKQKMLRIDPRSPTNHIDRTPIVFIDENADNEVNITLDASQNTSYGAEDVTASVHEISEALKEASLHETEPPMDMVVENSVMKFIRSHNTEDPRSPSVGIERTPILVQADIALQEEIVEENIIDSIPETPQEEQETASKPLLTATSVLNSFIFEEMDSVKFSTPKKALLVNGDGLQRTPLSCLGNKANDRVKLQKVRNVNNVNKLAKAQTKIFVDDQENETTPVLLVNGSKPLMTLSAKSRIPVFNRIAK